MLCDHSVTKSSPLLFRVSAVGRSKREGKDVWIVNYTDQRGDRHIKTFQRKKDADSYHARASKDVTAGVHIANSKSIMVIDAGRRGSRAAYAVRFEIDRTQRLCAVDESRSHAVVPAVAADRNHGLADRQSTDRNGSDGAVFRRLANRSGQHVRDQPFRVVRPASGH